MSSSGTHHQAPAPADPSGGDDRAASAEGVLPTPPVTLLRPEERHIGVAADPAASNYRTALETPADPAGSTVAPSKRISKGTAMRIPTV